MALLPAATENAGLDAMFTSTTAPYIGLNTASPGTTGANEVTGGSYVRQGATWAASSGGSKTTTNAQNFTSMPAEAGGITNFSMWSASTAGTYSGGGTVSGVTSVPAGATVAFAIGAITLSLS